MDMSIAAINFFHLNSAGNKGKAGMNMDGSWMLPKQAKQAKTSQHFHEITKALT